MQANHFIYGHTVTPPSDEDDDLEQLFVIGGKKIEGKPIMEDNESIEYSDQTVKNHHQKQKKKDKKKDKKKKKQKDKAKEHKNQKEKKKKRSKQQENEDIQAWSQKSSELERQHQLSLPQPRQSEHILQSSFLLSHSLSADTLKISILQMPLQSLFLYGPMDNEIPRYRRNNWVGIIGIKAKKIEKYKEILKNIDRKLGKAEQKVELGVGDLERYFHFEGYSKVKGAKINKTEQKTQNQTQILLFSANETQQSSLFLARSQLQSRELAANPQNVDCWIKFAELQDEMFDDPIERKLSILQKALQKNKGDEQISIIYFKELVKLTLPYEEMISKTLSLLRDCPTSYQLWQLHLQLTLHSFSNFSHPQLPSIILPHLSYLQQKIKASTSAATIFKLRKCVLLLLNTVVRVWRDEGYGGMATGLLIALIQFNFLGRQWIDQVQKYEEFKKYWQRYDCYRIGDLKLQLNWSNYLQYNPKSIDKESYIGNFSSDEGEKWRPTHKFHDKKLILSNPCSFNLFDDISLYLIRCSDEGSLKQLIDGLGENLGVGKVFGGRPIGGSIANRIVKYWYTHIGGSILSEGKLKRNNEFMEIGQFQLWDRYWNPLWTQNLFQEWQYAKIQYFKRVLHTLLCYSPESMIDSISQYIFFILCAFYLSPSIQKHLKQTPTSIKQQMHQLFTRFPTNPRLWALYIQTIFMEDPRKFADCIECYWNLLQQMQSNEDLAVEILYWMHRFDHRMNGNQHLKIMKALSIVLIDSKIKQSWESIQQIDSFTVLRLKLELSTHLNQMKATNSKSLYIFHILYFSFSLKMDINISKEISFSSLPPHSQIVAFKILSILKIQHWHYQLYDLFAANTIVPTLEMMKRWVFRYHGRMETIQLDARPILIDKFSRILSFWMFAMMRQPSYSFYDKVIFQSLKSKKAIFNESHPHSLLVLSSLMPQLMKKPFLFQCINHAPYSRAIFIEYLNLCSVEESKNILQIMEMKGFRKIQ